MLRTEPLAAQVLVVLAVTFAGPWTSSATADTSPAPSDPVVRTMTLAQAVAQARASQPAVRAALARVKAQERVAEIPRAKWLPTLGVTAKVFGATANNTTGTYVKPSFLEIPRIGGTRVTSGAAMQPYASSFAGAGITQEMFDFGRIAAQAAADDAKVDVEKARASGELLGVTYDVEEAYFAVFAAKQVVKASDDVRALARPSRSRQGGGRLRSTFAYRSHARRCGPGALRHRPHSGARIASDRRAGSGSGGGNPRALD